MNVLAKVHVRWRILIVEILTDHFNVYATMDTSELLTVGQAFFNYVEVSLG